VLRQNILNSNAQNLSSGAAIVQDSLLAANDLTLTISANDTLIQLINRQENANSYAIRQAANSMPRLHTANYVADRYFFYYPGHDNDSFVIGPQTAFCKPSIYYDSFFRYGDMSNDEFWAFIRGTAGRTIYPAKKIRYMNDNSQVLLMIVPYGVSSPPRTIGYFMIYFDQDRIMDLFTPLFESGAEWMGIYDGNGQLLASNTDADFSSYISADLLSLQGEGSRIVSGDSGKYTIQYCRDLSSGWFFVTLTPNQFFTAQTAPLLWIVLGGVSLFIILAFCLIRILNKNTQRPLAQIVNMLPLENDGQRGLWSLTESVERLQTDHEKLGKQLGERNTQLRDAAIVQLIKGTFEDEQELRLLLSHTGVEIDESTEYRGIYLKLLHQDALSEVTMPHIDYRHTVLAEAICAISPALQWLTLKNEKEYILLYTKLDGSLPLEELLTTVYSTLKNIYGVDAAFFVGIPCKGLRTLNQSFASAKTLSDGEQGGEKYLFMAEPRPLNSSYDYSAQDEAALLAAAQRNEIDKLNRLLDQLYDRNFNQRQLSDFLRQGLYSAMIHTLSRAACSLPLPPELTNIPVRLDANSFFQILRNQYHAISAWIQENRHRDSRLMLDNVLGFIDENFGNEEMSLTYAAMHFGLTEQYLSDVFKRRAGMNFSTYLERKRIIKAQEILRSSQMNVQSIAESVGYSNIRTFRRAYSRVLGHPPSEDRKMFVEGDMDPDEE